MLTCMVQLHWGYGKVNKMVVVVEDITDNKEKRLIYQNEMKEKSECAS